MATPLAVGFLGAGQMATALAVGWTRAGLLDPARARASDPFPAARAKFEQATGVTTAATNADVAAACDVLVLAVKPQVMAPVLAELRPHLQPRHLVVSIAAGVTLKTLAEKYHKRPEAALSLWRLAREPAAIALLVEELQPDSKGCDPYIRAVSTIGPAAAPLAVEPLRKLLKTPAYRIDAALALGRLGPAAKAAVKDLTDAAQVETKDSFELLVVRQARARVQPDEAALKLVSELLADPRAEVREGAARVLTEPGVGYRFVRPDG